MPGQNAQHALNDFLQLELLHSLGSYGVVAHYLGGLELRIREHDETAKLQALFPGDAIRATREYNRKLRDKLHRPAPLRDDHSHLQAAAHPDSIDELRPPRHPAPSPLQTVPKGLRQWVVDFYDSGLTALEAARGLDEQQASRPAERLGLRLRTIHDPARRGFERLDAGLLEGRIERNRARLKRAGACLELRGKPHRCEAILEDHLGQRDGNRLHMAVMWAFVEAHIGMHDVEHLTSHSFGDQVSFRTEIDPLVERSLERSIVLNTFVYVAARTAPWIFAEDRQERDYVIDHYDACCETVTPTYCMWISHQLTLLALQRRAYTWWLMGRADAAYRDFYKLKRFVRGLERDLGERVSRARGADLFLNALAALADHHTGRIYRVQHAYTTAVRHFERASHRLASLERLGRLEEPASLEREPSALEAVRDSRWRVDLLMNQGKAHYECGHVKRSLLCYARAWRAFLDLAVSESMAVIANVDVIDGVIEWLERVRDDPDVDKLQLAERFTPLVDQFTMVVGPTHLRLLSAEVMMRLGHLLFVLKLPEKAREGERAGRRVDHTLACRCLLRARWLDPSSTLSAGDILKIRRASQDEALAVPLPKDARADEPVPIALQWPAGGERFEEAARVIEYMLQTWLEHAPAEAADAASAQDHRIAHDLLNAFLAHTDSSNVKLAQVYRYLMQVAQHDRVPTSETSADERDAAPMLELVCMRRYSSFFPFLPRPSAFRVLGGGYFLRAIEPDHAPFGIAIDPGPNFLDNLYRCGFCIEDINMIVVTHDHADHVAALDALLALMRYRRLLRASTFSSRQKLLIVGNGGVVERYAYLKNNPRVRVLEFGEEGPPADVYPWPKTLQIEPVETADHDDAREHLAQGFLVRIGRGRTAPTMLFTSDTGIPPSLQPRPGARPTRNPDGSPQLSFARALDEAHVVVAHVSSVPLPELRALGGLATPPEQTLDTMRDLEEIWDASCRQILDGPTSERSRQQRFLLRQLQFGFHSLPRERGCRDEADQLAVTPLSSLDRFQQQPDSHLYLSGMLAIARHMAPTRSGKLLLVGELREELGAFRTRIAAALNDVLFTAGRRAPRALTADIGLKVRARRRQVEVLCTTCDLDNDLVGRERFHVPRRIDEVCIKGEDEAVFYNCPQHDPRQTWLERVERYDPFGP